MSNLAGNTGYFRPVIAYIYEDNINRRNNDDVNSNIDNFVYKDRIDRKYEKYPNLRPVMAYNYEDNINRRNNDGTKFNNDNYVYNDSKKDPESMNDNIAHSHSNYTRYNECKHYYKKSYNNINANFDINQKDPDRWIEINKEKKKHTVKSINNLEDFKNCTKNPFAAFNKAEANEGGINFGNLNIFDKNIDKLKQEPEMANKEICKHNNDVEKVKETSNKEHNKCINNDTNKDFAYLVNNNTNTEQGKGVIPDDTSLDFESIIDEEK